MHVENQSPVHSWFGSETIYIHVYYRRMTGKSFTIGKTKIGEGYPCFIVAEVGINIHSKVDRSPADTLKRGFLLIEEAYKARASAVKFQMFTAERMYPKGAGEYTVANGDSVDIWDAIKENELLESWIPKLKKHSNDLGLECFFTTCDEASTDVLFSYDVDAFKIASGELTHLPLLKHTALTKKPIILSTGGATLREVSEAVEAVQSQKNSFIAVMHCVMQYPAELTKLNLGVIKTLSYAFPEIVVGWSDHSTHDSAAPIMAVALGAKIVEKHFTLSRKLPGPDHSFALEPDDLKKMVKSIRDMEGRIVSGEKITVDTKWFGTSERKTYSNEKSYRDFIYRTIFSQKPISKGELFTSGNISVLRPGKLSRGLEPKYYDLLINKHTASRDIPINTALNWEDILNSLN